MGKEESLIKVIYNPEQPRINRFLPKIYGPDLIEPRLCKYSKYLVMC